MDVKERLINFILYKGKSVAEFERDCGLSNGFVNKVRKSVGRKALYNILRVFPDLNPVWVNTGEGEMLNPSSVVTQIAGDNNRNVNINGADDSIVKNLLAQIAEQQRMCDKFQQQIDRLLTIIEKKQ